MFFNYVPDPKLQKEILHVGDTVILEGCEVQVETITLIENSTLDGPSVPAVPWMAVQHHAIVTLSNDKWAYGDQIKRKE